MTIAFGPRDLVVTHQGCRFLGRSIPCAIGRGGMTLSKREGDGATPAGVHRIVGGYYRADRLARTEVPRWALAIGPRDLWSDDPERPDYNLLVHSPYSGSAERLMRADPVYDLVLVTDWNWPRARAGAGSAIFVHGWRAPRYPTAGCVAFRRDHLLWIARRIEPGARMIVAD